MKVSFFDKAKFFQKASYYKKKEGNAIKILLGDEDGTLERNC